MPADARPRRIFGDQHMLDAVGVQAGERGRLAAQADERAGDGLRLAELVGAEIVVPSEGNDLAIAFQPADEFERLERQRRDVADQRLFFGRRHDAVGIFHPFRKIRMRLAKQITLRQAHGHAGVQTGLSRYS